MAPEVMVQGSPQPFETLISQWLRMKGYIVQTPVNFRRMRGEVVKGRFWSDIDIVGTREEEVVIIECQEWLTASMKKTIESLETKFTNAKQFLLKIGVSRGKRVSLKFATMHFNPAFSIMIDALGKKMGNNVEYVWFDNVIKDMIRSMSPYLDRLHVGKFDEPIAWLLSRLIVFEWIAVECPHCGKYSVKGETCSSCGRKL
jgi:hypothetical protein